MPLEQGQLIASKYRLERPLAAGGMGAVWTARHVELDVEVALKFILEEQAEGADAARARFKREAQAAARLKSPHVAQIHDYGLEGNMPYIAMELLVGEDLATLLERQGRLSLDRATDIAGQLCRGLQVAHDAGIVHRDLKPSNIFLARMGEDDVVKILDFGIAKLLGVRLPKSNRTASGAIIGSPRYMSPEQMVGMPIGPASDLWSVGVVLFEMLTGQCPFENELVLQVEGAVGGGPHPAATEREPGLPESIDAFFERALALDPTHRFASAKKLADAFLAAAAGKPLSEAESAATQRVLVIEPATSRTDSAAGPSERQSRSEPSTKPSADLAYARTKAASSHPATATPTVSVRTAAPATRRALLGRPTVWLLGLGAVAVVVATGLAASRLGGSSAAGTDPAEAAQRAASAEQRAHAAPSAQAAAPSTALSEPSSLSSPTFASQPSSAPRSSSPERTGSVDKHRVAAASATAQPVAGPEPTLGAPIAPPSAPIEPKALPRPAAASTAAPKAAATADKTFGI